MPTNIFLPASTRNRRSALTLTMISGGFLVVKLLGLASGKIDRDFLKPS